MMNSHEDSATLTDQRAIGWTVFGATATATVAAHLLEAWLPVWAAWGLPYSVSIAAVTFWLQPLRHQPFSVRAAVVRGVLAGAVAAVVKLAIG